jgi:hypothetical protein
VSTNLQSLFVAGSAAMAAEMFGRSLIPVRRALHPDLLLGLQV